MGGFCLLPSRIGLYRAKGLMLTGRVFDAAEAYEIGLLNKIVPHDKLEQEVTALADTFAQGSTRAYAMIKAGLNTLPASPTTIMEIEADMQSVCFEAMDFKEGTRAFLEKRAPKFTG
jgi:enoyl-CoA hydratase/carnithine racemase